MAPLPELPRESLEQLLAKVLGRLDSSDSAPFEQAELTLELARIREELAGSRPQPSVVERLRESLGVAAEDEIELPSDSQTPSSLSAELIERLAAQGPKESRYRIDGEIARGGMGAVLKVFDPDLRRTLAMKVALERDEQDRKQRERTARFLEEARITGQLDHPGIVPVHELGLDSRGRLYFTMRLVRGHDLGAVYELARKGEDGWSTTRVLGVLLKTCEALAYAHSKGVIHRDLKPTNVMVGRFGEVYVMDWGLGKIVGRKDRCDLRIAREPESAIAPHDPAPNAEHSIDSSTSLVTLDGTVLGTPAYMSPEQARGEIDSMDARSDVYSLGAMLYHLLAGAPPYQESGRKLDPRQLWTRILAGPPAPLATTAPRLPSELVAVCERAMAPAPQARYPSVLELADDLRAFLENRVVRAYEAGALAEFKKWVRRNRFAAASTAALLVALVGGSIAFALVQQRARAKLQLASDRFLADALVAQSSELMRFDPALDAARQQWLGDANGLLSREHVHLAADDSSLEGQRWVQFAGALDRLHGEHSLLRAIEDHRGAMLAIEQASLGEQAVHAQWKAAIESIADRAQCPAYDGLVIEPQFGLLPIGRGAGSGLWEFAYLPTGAAPERDASTQVLKLEPACAVVLVLVPAGVADLPPPRPPDAPSPEPGRAWRHIPVGPCFVSKYEMTQAQWQRITGSNPSRFQSISVPRPLEGRYERPDLHPVEMVSAEDCVAALERVGLRLPTDVEWARVRGTEPPPDRPPPHEARDPHDPRQRGRERDRDRDGGPGPGPGPPPPGEFEVHVPVDAAPPNALGLFGLGGNVGEWCRGIAPSDAPPQATPIFVIRDRPRDPQGGDPGQGGLAIARERDAAIGVRPARSLDP